MPKDQPSLVRDDCNWHHARSASVDPHQLDREAVMIKI